MDAEFSEDDLTHTQKERAKWTRIENLVDSRERIRRIAQDIVTHFEQRLKANANKGKGMIVCMSYRIAVDLLLEKIEVLDGMMNGFDY